MTLKAAAGAHGPVAGGSASLVSASRAKLKRIDGFFRLNVEYRYRRTEMTGRRERSFHPRIFGAAVTVIVLWGPFAWAQPSGTGHSRLEFVLSEWSGTSRGAPGQGKIERGKPAEPLWRFDTHG